MTITQAAGLLGVNRTTVYRWTTEGKLPVALTVGKIILLDRDTVEQFEPHRRTPGGRRLIHQLDVIREASAQLDEALQEGSVDIAAARAAAAVIHAVFDEAS